MPYSPKTLRKWGALRNAMRARFSSFGRAHFTWSDFSPPLTPAQAKDNLRLLSKLGEIRKLRPGLRGHHSCPAVYTALRVRGMIKNYCHLDDNGFRDPNNQAEARREKE